MQSKQKSPNISLYDQLLIIHYTLFIFHYTFTWLCHYLRVPTETFFLLAKLFLSHKINKQIKEGRKEVIGIRILIQLLTKKWADIKLQISNSGPQKIWVTYIMQNIIFMYKGAK